MASGLDWLAYMEQNQKPPSGAAHLLAQLGGPVGGAIGFVGTGFTRLPDSPELLVPAQRRLQAQ